jgi:ABC-type transporter Mla subunit MlaD
MTNNEKIATLTGDAIRMSSEVVITEITNAAQTAERVAGDLRIEADQLATEIRTTTNELIGRINDFVTHCQNTSEKIREVRKDRVTTLEKTSSEVTLPKIALISDK